MRTYDPDFFGALFLGILIAIVSDTCMGERGSNAFPVRRYLEPQKIHFPPTIGDQDNRYAWKCQSLLTNLQNRGKVGDSLCLRTFAHQMVTYASFPVGDYHVEFGPSMQIGVSQIARCAHVGKISFVAKLCGDVYISTLATTLFAHVTYKIVLEK